MIQNWDTVVAKEADQVQAVWQAVSVENHKMGLYLELKLVDKLARGRPATNIVFGDRAK
ncbi:MAG TPA: hypothetical protein VNK46_16215 [Nitrospiraceae bacterium]|nr:hypothetical protein [Nitrospiraceae bacterium]